MMTNQIVKLTEQLILIPSIKDNPHALNKVIEIAKKELTNFQYKEFSSNGIPSIIFYNTPKFPKKFKIIMNAHLDVVPASEKLYKSRIEKNKLYGRGAFDMKAAGAAMILLFKELSNQLNFPLGLQLVTDEEVGGFNGVKVQIEKGVIADFVIAGEPTNFGINNKSKGIIWLKIIAKGSSAHGAYLWQGQNAIWEMKHFLDKLQKKYPVPKKEAWKTTINLSKIETSNQTVNKVPEDCIAYLDIRYIPEDAKTILENIKKILTNNMEMETLTKEPSQFTDGQNEYIKKLQKSTKTILGQSSTLLTKHGGSDVRYYTNLGIPAITFGPKGYGLHTEEEWVDTVSLGNYYKVLEEFLINCQGS